MSVTTITGAVRAILLNNSAVTTLVENRVYVKILPINCVFPAISIQQISDPYSRIKKYPRIQVSAWGKDPLILDRIKTAVEESLDGYSGTQGTIQISQINPVDAPELPMDSNTELYQIPYDFFVLVQK
jgi:hypothetical protein